MFTNKPTTTRTLEQLKLDLAATEEKIERQKKSMKNPRGLLSPADHQGILETYEEQKKTLQEQIKNYSEAPQIRSKM